MLRTAGAASETEFVPEGGVRVIGGIAGTINRGRSLG